MERAERQRVVVSSITESSRNPWSLIDLPKAFGGARSEVEAWDVAVEILDHAKVSTLNLFWVFSSAYPQYFLVKRGAVGRGKDCTYLVSVREESVEGLTIP